MRHSEQGKTLLHSPGVANDEGAGRDDMAVVNLVPGGEMGRPSGSGRSVSHDFQDERLAVRERVDVFEGRQAILTDDLVEFCLSFASSFGVGSAGEDEGEQSVGPEETEDWSVQPSVHECVG